MYKMLNHRKKPAHLHKDLPVYELPKVHIEKQISNYGTLRFEKQAINIHTAPWAATEFFAVFV